MEFGGAGGRTRTDDLRVMSATSYHCSTPVMRLFMRAPGNRPRGGVREDQFKNPLAVEEIEVAGMPGRVYRGQMNEANQRSFFERWAQLMAAETNGRFSRIPRVSCVDRSTSRGSTSEYAGTSRTSSKVSASWTIRMAGIPGAVRMKRCSVP